MATKDNMWLCKRYLLKECRGNYNNCVDCVLDKIRAEIEALEDGITSYYNDRPWIFKDEVLQIIDKYKAESEE